MQLQDLLPDELTEWLVGSTKIIETWRRLRYSTNEVDREGACADLWSLVDTIKAATDQAKGYNLRLLEVAEAYLRVTAAQFFSAPHYQLGLYIDADPQHARTVLKPLLVGQIYELGLDNAFGEFKYPILKTGVLRAVGEGIYDIRPVFRNWIRDRLRDRLRHDS